MSPRYGWCRRLWCAVVGHRIAYRSGWTAGMALLIGTPMFAGVMALHCTRCGLVESQSPVPGPPHGGAAE